MSESHANQTFRPKPDVSLQLPATDPENELLRRLVEGTAGASGDDFFQSLVKHLAGAPGVRFAFVAEFADSSTRVRTLAFWSGDKLVDNVEYELEGTPCEEVVRGSICHHVDNVARDFRDDLALKELNAASYLRVPLCDATSRERSKKRIGKSAARVERLVS